MVAGLVGPEMVRKAVVGDVLGQDLNAYLGFTRAWLAGDGFYQASQLGGPYVVEDLFANTYPPTLLYLTVPFALGLPIVLWWLVPIAITGAAVWRAKPAWWAWPLLALILAYPRTWSILVLGNPSLWALAAVSAGAVWHWPAVGGALKTTLLPFAVIGIGARSWWVATGIAAVLAVPFGAMWPEYVTSLANATSTRGLEYTLGEWPVAIALVVALASPRISRWASRIGRERC